MESLGARMMAMAMEKDDIPFSSLFSPAEVICQTEQTDRDKTLLAMLRLLARQHNIGSIEDAYEAVLARENELATVVAPGLAMPHARLETIDEIAVAVATSRGGIAFNAGKSDNRIKLIVLTLTPKSESEAYLRTLSSLARICQDPSTADVVASLATPEEIWSFFHRGGAAGRGNPKFQAPTPRGAQIPNPKLQIPNKHQ
jgi:mannitol/fructose-specific phosphotransferase system IIA component (Ntr-type)